MEGPGGTGAMRIDTPSREAFADRIFCTTEADVDSFGWAWAFLWSRKAFGQNLWIVRLELKPRVNLPKQT